MLINDFVRRGEALNALPFSTISGILGHASPKLEGESGQTRPGNTQSILTKRTNQCARLTLSVACNGNNWLCHHSKERRVVPTRRAMRCCTHLESWLVETSTEQMVMKSLVAAMQVRLDKWL
jgi:hypothetical protein